MRFARGNLRTHIDSYKNDRWPSYWPQQTFRQHQRLKIDFREIFGVFRLFRQHRPRWDVKSVAHGCSRSPVWNCRAIILYIGW